MLTIKNFDEYKDFNELFIASDNYSNENQKKFINLRKNQLISLAISALFAIFTYSFIPWLFIISIIWATVCVVLIWNTKPDQKWYMWRSMAESLKSASWQYMMKGEKFRYSLSKEEAQNNFSDFSNSLIRDSERMHIINTSILNLDKKPTSKMDDIRGLKITDRAQLYLEKRIIDQMKWYENKSSINNKLNNRFIVLSLVAFVASAVSILLDLVEFWQFSTYGTAIASLGVTVGISFLTWSQIRNYSNLKISYGYTALEIGTLKNEFEKELKNIANMKDEISKESKFAELIQNSENAFSREHTSWRARQQQI